ncbi:transglycosylase domain-containing protein [Lactococcus termiticola]|uniref:Transglycosylase n=1 Tax=Lactococcus termiticola TaxID=2169526 RepID=A0A2R5HDE6_9LACT|nr:transglycosylase domain-containing protein [Lactococcus termiticola]GBG96042.1 transglycosylase [Lactococcus termiticola]
MENDPRKEEAKAKLQEKLEARRSASQRRAKKEEAYANEEKVPVAKTTFTVFRGVSVIVGLIFLGFAVFGVTAGIGYFARLVENTKVESKEELLSKIDNIHGVSSMFYSNGQPISDISSDLVRVKADSSNISVNVKNALVATEDETFKTNDGVVPKAVIRGIIGSIGSGASSGGSTITQQLIKQQVLGDSVTFQRKASEIVYARQLTKYLSKDQILTDYLNVSPFGRNNKGQNIAGVEEAAQGIFGKSAKDLTVPEAAFIAGLPQSPIVYSPYSANGQFKSPENMAVGLDRQKNVLYNMYRSGFISEKDYQEYLKVDLTKEFLPPAANATSSHDYLYNVVYNEAVQDVYNYLIQRDKVSDTALGNDATKQYYQNLAEQSIQTGGYTITSTINQGIYEAMQNAVAQYGSILQDGTGVVQPGNVLMDNKTGAVLGFVGGLDYNSSQVNHAFDTERSPGSSTKPIIAYGPAVDMGLMGSASQLSNYPTSYSDGTPILHVGDKGTAMVSFAEALGVSWNIPAYWTYKAVQNNGGAQQYMEKMGYQIKDYSVESLPLGGGIDPTVVQHTNGYATLANGGVYNKYYTVQEIKDDTGKVIYKHQNNPVQVYSEATSTIMENMLRGVLTYNPAQRTTNFLQDLQGINPGLASSVDFTGKTGTTNDYVDGWLMLSTPTVSLGGWIGHDDNSSMGEKTGAVNNGTYMSYLVNAINAADPNVFGPGQKFPDPAKDDNVIKSTVLSSTGEKPGTVTGGKLKNVTVSGATTTSFWAKDGAPTTQYQFGIGGTDADYANAWSKIIGK